MEERGRHHFAISAKVRVQSCPSQYGPEMVLIDLDFFFTSSIRCRKSVVDHVLCL